MIAEFSNNCSQGIFINNLENAKNARKPHNAMEIDAYLYVQYYYFKVDDNKNSSAVACPDFVFFE